MLTVPDRTRAKKAPKPFSPIPVASVEADRISKWFDEQVRKGLVAPFSEIVTVTPSLALLLLGKNESNRPISEVNLDRIKRDMMGNRWVFNGEAVVVSKDGHLNDGQHRMRAVAETGCQQRMVLVFGASRDSRMTLDQGVTRTVGHYLGMSGHTDAAALASAANYAWQWKQKGRLSTDGRDRPTKSEALLIADHYRDLADSLQFVSRNGVGAICTRSLLAFCHWAVSQKASSGCDMFFDRLIKGTGLMSGDPILYCRNRLIAIRGRGASIHERAELVFRAWNLHRANEKCTRIVVSGTRLPELEK